MNQEGNGPWPPLPPARPGAAQLMTLPPFFSHSALGTVTTPLPLQEFWPAQLLPAPAPGPCPLHALLPLHFTCSLPAFSSARALMAPLANSVAAAVAIRIPLLALVIDISFSPRNLGMLFELPALDARGGGSFHPSGRARPATPSRARAIEGSNGSAAGVVRTAAPRRGDRRRVRERAGRPVRVR